MQEFEMELAVGDTVQIGEHLFTVVDIDGDEVSFRIEEPAIDDEIYHSEFRGELQWSLNARPR